MAGGVGITNCGGDAESCCTSLAVAGGTYYRTYTASDAGPSDEGDPATISSFRLDKYLVTVGRFRQFVAAWNNGMGFLPSAGAGKHTHLNGGLGLVDVGAPVDAGVVYETGWVTSYDGHVAPTDANLACANTSYPATWTNTWTNMVGSQENLPINCVNWYERYAFCIWDGGFLPSEAEWEYAAVGGSQQRLYPWGSTDPGTVCPGTGCEYAIYSCVYPSSGTYGGVSCSGLTNIAPVGTAGLGAGYWGQLDLAGELWEGVLDWYTAYVNPCVDCANLSEVSLSRMVRGGAYYEPLVPSSLRYEYGPGSDDRSSVVGFRCARAP